MTANFWDGWKKPWSREQCTSYYIEIVDAVSDTTLAKISGRDRSSITRWRKADNWEEKRQKYQADLQRKTREKLLEKNSSDICDELSKIAKDNYEAHVLARDYAVALLRIKMNHINEQVDKMNIQAQLEALDRHHKGYDANFISLVLDRATKGIEAATGLSNYVNINTAIQRVEKEGLLVVEPERDEIQPE